MTNTSISNTAIHRHRRVRQVLVGAVAASALGLGGVALANGGGDSSGAPLAQVPAPVGPNEPIELDQAVVAVAAAASPVEVVREFLDARISGDAARSLALLADEERSAYVSVDDWVVRSEALPEIVSYDLVDTTGPSVIVDAQLTPRLDAVAGFRPARATITWETVAEAGGYRLSLAATRLTPQLPDESGATAAAGRWIAAAQQCRSEGQYAGNLLGDPLIAEQLCGTDDRFDAGRIELLRDFVDPFSIQSALGADASVFTRVVRFSDPAPLDVVTAPLGDQWQVVGVAPPP